ncbi:hypothetical protein M409DRAFT_51178 [Zasmidium cellare ATCC 36951]|uniref:Uncharacterized protein n=1 Tax=Zasmidium cellare ATCC 36951 TaxID=1080233 RepID=A0A6A6CXF8_ZASCE|nr:uncharacterized protein M409DRAFT_51178 [Zasmidium cellare ATCC 36951]KAF2170938.1 hypothetical protein M409DRAFT_51178 [Zasmidium cellare ATCC 36951]
MLFTLFLGLPFSQSSPSCHSVGIDYQDGGSYFLEASRSLSFTALQYFSDCQNDFADNLLIDPSGNEKRCNRTPMQPDGLLHQVDCEGINVYTGDWSILILSYNGGAEPLMDQRDFHLSVEEPIDVDTTPSQRPRCHITQAETVSITSLTWSCLSIDMPSRSVESTAALATTPPSAMISIAVSNAIPSAESTLAIVLYSRPAEATTSYTPIGIDETHHPRQTQLTIGPSPVFERKGSTKSRSVEMTTPTQQKSGKFWKPLSMGWRPSNVWRYVFAVEQSRMLDNAYAIRQPANIPVVAITTGHTTSSQQMLSVRGQRKRL